VGQGKAPAESRCDLDALLRSSDVVAVLVSINPDRAGLLGERELALMKPSCTS